MPKIQARLYFAASALIAMTGISREADAFAVRPGLNFMGKVGIKGQGPQEPQTFRVCVVDITSPGLGRRSNYRPDISAATAESVRASSLMWFHVPRGSGVIYPKIEMQTGAIALSISGPDRNRPLKFGCIARSDTESQSDMYVFLDWDTVDPRGAKFNTSFSKQMTSMISVIDGRSIFIHQKHLLMPPVARNQVILHEIGHSIVGLDDLYGPCPERPSTKLYNASDNAWHEHPWSVMAWSTTITPDDRFGTYSAWLRSLQVGMISMEWLNERSPELVQLMG
ncbi:MAG: hypothetical protein RIQ81_2743, partial [Pseudomonadota bacterium]